MWKVLIASFLICAAGVDAAALVKTGGPIGGLGYDVRIHPADKTIMFVTDNWSGVNKSTNAGATWSNSNVGIDIHAGPSSDAVPIFSLTVDPNEPDRIWAGTQGEGADFGVFRSDDGGATWTRKVGGIALGADIGLVFRGFTVEPGNSNVVYALAEVPTIVEGREFNRTKGRVYKTTNAGDEWVEIWQGDSLARYLIVHPSNTQVLYVSTGIFDREAFDSDCGAGTPGGVGVLMSPDGGTNWSTLNDGLTDLYVGSLRMSPSDADTLLAATGNNACSGAGGNMTSGLFKTTDGGDNWTEVIGNDIMTTVAFSPSDADVVYAGSAFSFYRSEDGGDTWTPLQRPEGIWGPPGIRAGVPIDVTVDPDDPNTLYANNYGGGVFKSTDGAQTWISWSAGYTGAEIHDVDVSPQNSSLVYAIGRSGPFKSHNGGASWIGIANGEAAGFPEWNAIRQKPDDVDVLIMSDEHQGVIFRSTDRGRDFASVFTHPSADAGDPDKRQGFKALAFAPSEPSIVYAGLAKDRNSIDSSSPVGTVIYKSIDGGETWTGIPTSADGNNVNAIAVHPTDPDIAYAATTAGIFKTTDGAGWSLLSGGIEGRDVRCVTIRSSTPQTLYAGEENGGVWKSTDGGISWDGPKTAGFSSGNPSIRGVAAHPDDASLVYAGDWSSGLYQSADGGETWSALPGLSTRAVRAIARAADGVLYVATHGEGVFRDGAVDSDPPSVISTTPTDNATGVAIDGPITATFSEEIDAETLTASTFNLSGAVGATITYGDAVATLTPLAALETGTTYTATIAAEVKDLAGNAIGSAHTWQFTTETTTTLPSPTTTTLPPPTTTTTVPAGTTLPPGSTTTSTGTPTTTSTTSTTLIANRPCGDPAYRAGIAATAGTAVTTASDALFVLRTSVGSQSCAACVCDVNGSGSVTASDALVLLKFAVGQAVSLNCPPCTS